MNTRATIAGLEALNQRMRAAARAGLFEGANVIMTDAKRRVPVDLGTLKGSGQVHEPTETADGLRCRMGFGDGAESYAIVQHERLDFKHPDGGEAKYLENAVNAQADAAFRVMASRLKGALNG